MRLRPYTGLSLAAMVVAAVWCRCAEQQHANARRGRRAGRCLRSGDEHAFTACRRRAAAGQAGGAGAAGEEGRRQRDAARRRHCAALGRVRRGRGDDRAAHPRRRERQRQEQLRRLAARARGETRQREHHRPVDEGGRRSERPGQLRQRRRDAADACRARGQRRRGEHAAPRGCEGERARKLERAVAAPLGGRRRARRGRRGAHRRRRRHPPAIERGDDAVHVRRAQGRHGDGEGVSRGRRRTSTRSGSILQRRCSSRSSTATKISSTCCSRRAPIRTSRADRPTSRCRARKRARSKSRSRRRRIAIS